MSDPTPRPDAAPDVLAADHDHALRRLRLAAEHARLDGVEYAAVRAADVTAVCDALADLDRRSAPDLAAIEGRALTTAELASIETACTYRPTGAGMSVLPASAPEAAKYALALLAHIAATRERHAAEVAAARAEALREAAAACANLADGYGATDSDAMAFACADAVAALATKGAPDV